jgi:hypothetical protein
MPSGAFQQQVALNDDLYFCLLKLRKPGKDNRQESSHEFLKKPKLINTFETLFR